MATGFPGRELGFGVQAPMPTRSDAATAGLLKRSLTEMERLQLQQQQQHQHQQLQHAHLLRSVKQRTLLASPVASHLSPPADLSAGSSSSLVLSNLMASGLARRQEMCFSAPSPAVASGAAESRPSAVMRDRFRELERRLLLDDDEEEDAVSASGSAVTTAEWSEAMRQLITQPAPAEAVANRFSPSPTNSSSSTVSSSASCSPPSSSALAAAASSLRQMLLDTAAAVADGSIEAASTNLAVLKRAANHRGDAEQRLTAVMVAVLFSRMSPMPPPGSSSNPIAELCSAEHSLATQMLYELSPCFKLGLMAANLAILEATKDQPRIHILDFEVGHGGQYVALLHALADRRRLWPTSQSPALRITAVADPSSPFTNNNGGNLRAVGDKIEKLAEVAGLAVRFDVVRRPAAELDAVSVGCEQQEALAVNLAFALSRIPDESVTPTNPRDELLRRVRALRPRVVTLVEQEINTNTAAFAARFAEACAHYGALLESLDATAARDSAERARVEAGLARRAVNSVAREGGDRVERCEVFGKWRARMRMAGFDQTELGPAVVDSIRKRLAAVRSNPGFTVAEDAGRIGFGWKGRVVTVASTWH